MLAFKIRKKSVPRYLTEYYVLVRDVHSHSTRGRITDMYPCRFKSLMGNNSFLCTSSIACNDLPCFIKQIKAESVFRKEVKNGFFVFIVNLELYEQSLYIFSCLIKQSIKRSCQS